MLKVFVVAMLFVTTSAFANEGAKSQPDNAQPAHRYSGSAPVDLSRGLPFNNGTWGKSNPEYEAQSQAGYLAPGIRATPYSYEQQGVFVSKIRDYYRTYEDAISNLKHNKDQRAEVKAYREEMLKNLEARLDASKDATKKAASANENEWPQAQDNARKAFADLQALLVRNNTHYE